MRASQPPLLMLLKAFSGSWLHPSAGPSIRTCCAGSPPSPPSPPSFRRSRPIAFQNPGDRPTTDRRPISVAAVQTDGTGRRRAQTPTEGWISVFSGSAPPSVRPSVPPAALLLSAPSILFWGLRVPYGREVSCSITHQRESRAEQVYETKRFFPHAKKALARFASVVSLWQPATRKEDAAPVADCRASSCIRSP